MKIDYSRKVKAKLVRAYFGDFSGDVRKWQEAYFELIAWKNTFGIPYSLDIKAWGSRGPYVEIVLKNGKAVANLETAMTELGYKSIKIDDVNVEVFSPEIDDNLPIEEEVQFYFDE